MKLVFLEDLPDYPRGMILSTLLSNGSELVGTFALTVVYKGLNMPVYEASDISGGRIWEFLNEVSFFRTLPPFS